MDDPIVISTNKGQKIIIKKLVLNIHVNSVQQLNINPQMVQNILKEKLDDIIDKILKKQTPASL